MGRVTRIIAGAALVAASFFVPPAGLFGVSLLSGAAIAGAGASLAIGGISSFLQPRPQLSGGGGIGRQGRSVAIAQQATPTRVIYGTRLVQFGTLVWADLTGDNNEYLRLAGVWCNHEITAVDAVYFDGVLVTELTGSPEALAFIAPYTDNVFMEVAYGTDDQSAFPQLTSDTSGAWGATDRCRGHAGAYLRFLFDPVIFPNGLPKIEFLLRGKPVYDEGQAGIAYSANGANVVRDYLTNTRFGLGMTFADRVDEDAYIAAFNLSDEDLTVPDYSTSPVGSTTEKRYEIHAQFETTEEPGQVLNLMMASLGGGGLPYISGKFHILPAAYRAPAVTLDESDFISPISYTSRKIRYDAPNTLRGTFLSPERQWKQTSFPEVQDAAALAADGEEVAVNISLPFTTSQHAAQRLAWLALQKMRLQKPLSITTKLTGYQVQAGDGLAIDFSALSWTGQGFEVVDTALTQLSDANGNPFFGISLQLVENPSSIYDDFDDYEQVPESEPPVNQVTYPVHFIDEDGCSAVRYADGSVVVIACPDVYTDVGWRFAVDESQFFDPFDQPAFRLQDNGSRAIYRLSMTDISDSVVEPIAYSFDETGRYLAVLYKLHDLNQFLARLYYLGESGLLATATIDAAEDIYALSALLVESAYSNPIDAFDPEQDHTIVGDGDWLDVVATRNGRLYVLEATEELNDEAETEYWVRVKRINGGVIGATVRAAMDTGYEPSNSENARIIDPQLPAVLVTDVSNYIGTVLHLPLLLPIYEDVEATQLDFADLSTRSVGRSSTANSIQLLDPYNLIQRMIRRLSGAYTTLSSTNTSADLNATFKPAAAVFSGNADVSPPTGLGHYLSDGSGEVREFVVSADQFTVEAEGQLLITPGPSPEANMIEMFNRLTLATSGPADGATVTIGDIVYTFRNTVSSPYDVLITASGSVQNALNLIAAINEDGTPGTEYGNGTVEHPDVFAETGGNRIVRVGSKGTATEHIAFSTSLAAPNIWYVGRLPAGIGTQCWRQMPDDPNNYTYGGFMDMTVAFGVRAELQE